jgi:hypothetical protein
MFALKENITANKRVERLLAKRQVVRNTVSQVTEAALAFDEIKIKLALYENTLTIYDLLNNNSQHVLSINEEARIMQCEYEKEVAGSFMANEELWESLIERSVTCRDKLWNCVKEMRERFLERKVDDLEKKYGFVNFESLVTEDLKFSR